MARPRALLTVQLMTDLQAPHQLQHASSLVNPKHPSIAHVDVTFADMTFDATTMWSPQPEFMNRKDNADSEWTYYQNFPAWLLGQPGLDSSTGNWIWSQSRVLGYFAADMSLGGCG